MFKVCEMYSFCLQSEYFVSRINSDRMGLSAAKLFNVDYSTILSVSNTCFHLGTNNIFIG